MKITGTIYLGFLVTGIEYIKSVLSLIIFSTSYWIVVD